MEKKFNPNAISTVRNFGAYVMKNEEGKTTFILSDIDMDDDDAVYARIKTIGAFGEAIETLGYQVLPGGDIEEFKTNMPYDVYVKYLELTKEQINNINSLQ